MTDKLIIKSKEAKAILGCGETKLWMLEKQGILIPSRIGNTRYYKVADIHKLLGLED